jgi:hypothetical protein
VSIQCARRRNDSSANSLIREASRLIYETYDRQKPPAAKEKKDKIRKLS